MWHQQFVAKTYDDGVSDLDASQLHEIFLSLILFALAAVAQGKPARFVRIEILGDKECIQIAEIEIMSRIKGV